MDWYVCYSLNYLLGRYYCNKSVQDVLSFVTYCCLVRVSVYSLGGPCVPVVTVLCIEERRGHSRGQLVSQAAPHPAFADTPLAAYENDDVFAPGMSRIVVITL